MKFKRRIQFKLPKFYKETVIQDKYDELKFRDMLRRSEELRNLPKTLEIPTADTLHKDTFMLFFKLDPKFRKDDEVYPAYRFNKEVLSKAVKCQEYRQLRNNTKLDEVNSTIATVLFTKTVIAELLRRNPQLPNILNNLTKTPLNRAKPPKFNVPISAVKKALQQTVETMKALSYAESWGLEDAPLRKVSPDERLALANLLLNSEKFKKLMTLVGKFRNLAISTKSRAIRKRHGDVTSVTVGKDLTKAVPSELAKLGHPLLKHEVLSRLANGKILQYETKPKDALGKGDFVACVDLSGTMNGIRELWAKAVVLASMLTAVKQKRRFAIVFFSKTVKDVFVFDHHNRPTLEDLVRIAETFYGGGKNFVDPLEKAMELTQNVNGDILFITDGICEIPDDFVQKFDEFKRKTETRLITVLINAKPSKAVKLLSDRIVEVSDLSEDARKVFESLQA